MWAWATKHWKGLLGALALNFAAIWHGIKWLWDWAGRLDVVASHMPSLHGAGGMISFISNPPPWTVFVTGILGVLVVLWDVRRPKALSNIATTKNRMGLYLGLAITCLLLSAGFGFAAYWQYKHPAPPEPQETALFKAARDDFTHIGGVGNGIENVTLPQIEGQVFPVTVWIHSDLNAMATYLVFYVPSMFDMPTMPATSIKSGVPNRQTFEVLKEMADRFSNTLKVANAQGSMGTGDFGPENLRYTSEAAFSGAIYAYYEGNLTEDERVALRAVYTQRGARIFFRSRRYLTDGRPKKD